MAHRALLSNTDTDLLIKCHYIYTSTYPHTFWSVLQPEVCVPWEYLESFLFCEHKTEMTTFYWWVCWGKCCFRMHVPNTPTLSQLKHTRARGDLWPLCTMSSWANNSAPCYPTVHFLSCKIACSVVKCLVFGRYLALPRHPLSPLISQSHSRPLDKWVLYFTSVHRGQRPHTALYFSWGNGCAPWHCPNPPTIPQPLRPRHHGVSKNSVRLRERLPSPPVG